jgi:hypothetical protein
MEQLPVVLIACKVFEEHFLKIEDVRHHYLDYGLHRVPKQLNSTLQAQIDAIEDPSLIVLGYGLCGNGLHGIEAGIHTLVAPRVDDCIAIFYGSREVYLEQMAAQPGTYYLTKGWLEVGSDPLSEYQALVEKYGQKTADWLMEAQYRHYRRLMFVAHRQEDLEAYRPRALAVAAYCERFDMVFEEYLGSEAFLDQITALLENGQVDRLGFIVVPPGERLTQEMYR